MKHYCISVFLVIAFGQASFSQATFTLEEAVLNARNFIPTTLEQYGWIEGTDTYYYVKDSTLMTGKPKGKGGDKKLFTLSELSKWKGGDALKVFPMLHWTSSNQFWFQDGMKYYETDLKTKITKQVAEQPKDANNADYHPKSDRIAFTKENNLFALVDGRIVPVTGNEEDVVSGQSISRNEYGISKGTFWSPDGSKLAFYEKDERHVTNYPLTDYNKIPAEVREIKYPFAGGKSEIVRVGVFEFATNRLSYLKPEGELNDQYYLTNLAWNNDGTVIYLAKINRATTDFELLSFDPSTGKQIASLFKEHSDKWVEPEQPVHFLPGDNTRFLWFSQRTGNNNLYLYHTSGRLINSTKLNWELTEIVGFTPKNDAVFVMGTGENPTEMHCFKIMLSNMSVQQVDIASGTHQVEISHSGSFALDKYSSISVSNNIDLLSTQKRLIRNLHNSANPFANRKAATVELFPIKAADGKDLWCRIMKPSDFDPNKKYPVVVYVYGGPHAQMVVNRFNGGASYWMNALAEMGYIVFTLDNHGSGNRGQAWEHVIHRQLGKVESEDQMLGVEWLKKQTYIDAERMAIHGWSFGGYMTTTMMLKYPDVFKAGVAGGPVIDWALYEVMYGERYMDTPSENPDGYKSTDLTQHVKNLKGKLLMIHGTDDDVVVMQHNMKFLKACVDNKVQVDFFAYPGHPHNVQGRDRYHLLKKVIDYMVDALN